jgi:fatty acid desaturase
MQLRNAADRRALIWAFVLFPCVPALGFARPAWLWWLLPIELYLAYCAGVLVHNHVHCPVFRDRRANAMYAIWLSVFYGFPAFAWIPTHNQNHHRYLNGEGDLTRTSRGSRRDGLGYALIYPWLSSYHQAPAIRRFARAVLRRGGPRAAAVLAQSVAVPLAHAALLALSLARYGAAQGGFVYALSFGVPALFAPWSMMFTNYVQHVGCDPASRDDHSRNFVSPLANWFVFNAGYHTVHHESPGTHWSRYPALHRARAAAIAPALNQGSIPLYCLRAYVLRR